MGDDGRSIQVLDCVILWDTVGQCLIIVVFNSDGWVMVLVLLRVLGSVIVRVSIGDGGFSVN